MSFKIAEDKHECTGKQECISVGCVPPACLPYPACTGQVGVSQHALGRGVSVHGGVCPWGCLSRGVCSDECLLGGVCPGGVSAQEGCLPRRGVCPGGVSAQEGCLPRRGVCPGGVSAQEGCLPRGVCLGVSAWGCLLGGCLLGGCLLGGVCSRGVCSEGCLPRGVWQTPPLWTDRHLWKHNLHKLHLQVVNIVLSLKILSQSIS